MERSGRLPISAEVECIVAILNNIQPCSIPGFYLIELSNGARYMVDENYITKEELNRVIDRRCYWQYGKHGLSRKVYDYVEM